MMQLFTIVIGAILALAMIAVAIPQHIHSLFTTADADGDIDHPDEDETHRQEWTRAIGALVAFGVYLVIMNVFF
jgi:uncharacterized membrane protein YccC